MLENIFFLYLQQHKSILNLKSCERQDMMNLDSVQVTINKRIDNLFILKKQTSKVFIAKIKLINHKTKMNEVFCFGFASIKKLVSYFISIASSFHSVNTWRAVLLQKMVGLHLDCTNLLQSIRVTSLEQLSKVEYSGEYRQGQRPVKMALKMF